MNGILKFFLNALKAIFFSPFYLGYLLIDIILSLINHLVGEVRILFTGFTYGSKKENKYQKEIEKIKKQNMQGGNGQ